MGREEMGTLFKDVKAEIDAYLQLDRKTPGDFPFGRRRCLPLLAAR
jgi:hypothetical protein